MAHDPSPDRLVALDKAHVWHPFTAMRQWRDGVPAEPLVIARGEGEFLIDTRGRRYIDGVSSLWCNVHGHRVGEIDHAIRAQLDKIAHSTLLGLAGEPSVELAAELVRVAPRSAAAPLNKVFFSDSGATALEAAFKMAVGYWFHRGKPGKNRFVGFTGGYHGDTTGSMSVGYSEYFHRPFAPMTFPTYFAPTPASLAVPQPIDPGRAMPGRWRWRSEDPALATTLLDRALAELDRILRERADEVAAVVLEPLVQGAGGMICQPPGFLRGVADLARRHGVLFIADEVATGFCRTGKLFACEHEGVQPDILCLAKGITGGYLPLAATLATDEIEQAFCGEYAQARTLFHGHTYTGNALACAAALASLKLIESSRLLDRVNRNAAIIADRLDALRDPVKFPHVLDVRQRGMMGGIELCEDRAAARPLDPAKRTGSALCAAMRAKGLILRPLGDTLVLMPIPAMSEPTLHQMLDIVIEAVAWS